MTIWAGTPKNHYIVTTDQGRFHLDADGRIDYKKTIANIKAAGYTNVRITYIGRRYQ